MTESWNERQAKLEADSPKVTKWLFALIGLVVLGVGALVFGFVLRGNDAPAEPNIEDAVAAAREDSEVTSTTTDTPTTTDDDAEGVTSSTVLDVPADGIEGTWQIDTSQGTVDPTQDENSGSFVGFRVDEQLTVAAVTAVGRTGVVTGTIELVGTQMTAAEITADMTAIASNDSGRDGKMRQALETDTFPNAIFVLSEPVDFGAGALEGTAAEVTATGDLTVHGVTNPISIPLAAQLVGGRIVVVGKTDITFADYGVTAPSAPIVVSVEDQGILELQLFFTR